MNYVDMVYETKNGNPMTRLKWIEDETDIFIFKQIPAVIQSEFIHSMQSLPSAVKGIFAKRGMEIRYLNQFCMVNEDNVITNYAPTTEDMNATDWVIYEG